MTEGQLPLIPDSPELKPPERDITEVAQKIGAAARPFEASGRTSEAARDQGWGPPVEPVDEGLASEILTDDGAVPMPQHVRDQVDKLAANPTEVPLGTVPRHVADAAANDAFWRRQAKRQG